MRDQKYTWKFFVFKNVFTVNKRKGNKKEKLTKWLCCNVNKCFVWHFFLSNKVKKKNA